MNKLMTFDEINQYIFDKLKDCENFRDSELDYNKASKEIALEFHAILSQKDIQQKRIDELEKENQEIRGCYGCKADEENNLTKEQKEQILLMMDGMKWRVQCKAQGK